jgi:SAM-dependent methyltransferase
LFGVDIRPAEPALNDARTFDYRQVNFALEPLPFPDAFFDSISAFDVLEHIPRQIVRDETIAYPFIELMNELYRVLKPGGLLLAVTPAYPYAEAFQDPTHVNILTKRSGRYFCGDHALARIYGFRGHFEARIDRFCVRSNYYDRRINPTKAGLKRWYRRLFRIGALHLVWEFEAQSERDERDRS